MIKKIIGIVTCLILVAGLVLAYLMSSKEQAAEREREKPVATVVKLSQNTKGEAVVSIDEETQKRIGLAVAPLVSAELAPEIKGYGRVIDPALFSASVADLVSSQATADASQKEVERLRVLSGQDNASTRALQGAEAAAVRDGAAAEASRQRLLTAWGKAFSERRDLPEFAQLLASGENSLARVDLLPGEIIRNEVVGGRLVALGDESNTVSADVLGPAPSRDAQTQAQGFFLLVKEHDPALTPGAAVTGYLSLRGDKKRGVLIPRDAVTRFNGRPWIYLQTGAQAFTRREVWLDHLTEQGWFESEGFKAGESVVVRGTRLLLSEEQKSQVRLAD